MKMVEVVMVLAPSCEQCERVQHSDEDGDDDVDVCLCDHFQQVRSAR